MSVRVRYAPSPTGLQHIGGIRTALFNYFFAKANKGRFILRVEDTDQGRSTPEALEDLYDSLNWLGIEYDEGPGKERDCGPYVQSKRLAIYRDKVTDLIKSGNAYPCFCTPERLDRLRQSQKAAKSDIGYDRKCRNLSKDESLSRLASNERHVIRLKAPLEGKTEFVDLLLGRTGRKNKDINPDPVILKTDGFPTYHLANVIDDHMMGITHIMRAQEWIPSGPLHVLIYKAFGWPTPHYCHLPMVMGKDGQKLSKRHGATALTEFRRAGYLPEALINFISLLGWGYDDSREFFTMDELCELFSLEKINKSPSVFDYRKLEWFNGQYIRIKEPSALKTELKSILTEDRLISNPPTMAEENTFEGAFPIIRERLKRLKEVSPMLRFLFTDPGIGSVEDAIPKKMDGPTAAAVLKTAMKLLSEAKAVPSIQDNEACARWDEEREAEFRAESERRGWKIGTMMQPLRLAVTSSKISPPLFPAIRLLGIRQSLERADRLIGELEKLPSLVPEK